MSQHSLLSASSAARWTRCTGSVAMSRDMPNLPNEYSAEGTAYHTLAYETLTYGRICADRVPQVFEADGFKFTIDDENAAHAQTYVDAVRLLPGEQLYEVQLDTSELLGVPEQGGTADCVTLDIEHSTIHVDDLKFGRGETIYAKDNEQLLLYAGAALLKFDLSHDWKYVRVGIHQPRLGHYDEHIYTRHEVEQAVAAMRIPAQKAKHLYDHTAEYRLHMHLTPGEKQCRWCPVRATCQARTDSVLKLFPVVSESNVIPITKMTLPAMSDDLIAYARDRVDEIEQWCKDIKAEAHQRAVNGHTIKGWKIITGKLGNRKWKDDQEAEIEAALALTLGDAAYQPREILSPTGAEKALRKHKEQWAALQAAIERAPGAATLVRDINPAPALPAVEFGITPEQLT